VFGPVDFETLKTWACDGRLSPTNEVSANGTDWKFATSIRALDMDWVAEVTPSTFYGPIHRLAMEDLIKEGSISAQSSFFVRRLLGETAEQQPASAQADDRLRRLGDEIGLLRQQVSAGEAHARQANLSAEEMKRLLSAHVERVQAQSASQVEQLHQQLVEQRDQAQRQADALAEEAKQARQYAVSVEEQLRVTVQQMAEQSEQANAAQRQWLARVEAQAAELEQLRGERREADARTAAVHEEQVSKLKQSLSEALAAVNAASQRYATLETSARAVAQVPVGFEASLKGLADELKSVRQQVAALGEQLARQAPPQRETDAASAGVQASLKGLGEELKAVRQQLATLGEQLDRQASARNVEPAERVIERVEAEPIEAEVLPPERSTSSTQTPEAERMSAERRGNARPPDASPSQNAGRTSPGLSLAELEQQARRELERLGAQGATLFKKKR